MPVRMERWNQETRTSEPVVLYAGAVLETRERNYRDDSDFYAIVWDEETQSIREVEYDTTRFAGGGSATVDATEEVRVKAEAYLRGRILADLVHASEELARKPEKGATVRIVNAPSRGKNAQYQDRVGVVSWSETRRSQYGTWSYGTRLGVDLLNADGAPEKGPDGRNLRVFVDADRVEVVTPAAPVPSREDLEQRAAKAARNRCWAYLTAMPGVYTWL